MAPFLLPFMILLYAHSIRSLVHVEVEASDRCVDVQLPRILVATTYQRQTN